MGVEVVYDYDNTPLDEVSRDGVAEETDIALLQRWSEELSLREMEMRTSFYSMDANDISRVGLGRKLGYVRIALRWVQLRLTKLGAEEPMHAGASEARAKLIAHAAALQKSLGERNAKIKALNIENTALKAAMRLVGREVANG